MSHQYQEALSFIQKLLRDKQVNVSLDTLLFKEKLLNSMNILDLMGFIEKRLGRRLKDEEIVMDNFQSVRKIVDTFLSPG